MQDSSNKFTSMTIFLHWFIGITVIVLIAVGLYMSENEVWDLYPIHKSIGIILFLFILYRIVRRMQRGWPTPIGENAKWELLLSKTIHWILILGTLLFPISGMMMSGASGNGIAVFGFDLLAANYNAAGEAVAINETLANIGHETHEILGTVMIIAIALHILAALKHHYIVKDNTLKRMLGK